MRGRMTNRGNIKVPFYRQVIKGDGKRRRGGREVEFDVDAVDAVLVATNIRSVRSPPEVESLPGELDLIKWDEVS